MHKLKDILVQALTDAGFRAQAGGLWRMGEPLKEPKVAVSLRRAQVEQGAVWGYLGMDEQGEERYGVGLTVVFLLTILSPKSGGVPEAEALSQRVMEQLLYGQTGVAIRSMVLDQAEYDSVRDCVSQNIQVETGVLAWGQKQEAVFRVEDFRFRSQFS